MAKKTTKKKTVPKGTKAVTRKKKVVKTRKTSNLTVAERKKRKKTAEEAEEKVEHITIPPPNMPVVTFSIRSSVAMLQNRFGAKAMQQMREDQELGGAEKKKRGKKVHDPKDFEACYLDAMHKSTEGWHGIPAPAFRTAMVTACKTVGFVMELAKLSIFIVADGMGTDGTPLVKITKGEPEMNVMPVVISKGKTDLRARPIFKEWEADVRIRYDADQFTLTDVANLLARVGLQVGIGEGRPASKNSAGLGYGLFDVVLD
jgi:hypothetical protein